jgi:ribose 5-phosphate isomerase B
MKIALSTDHAGFEDLPKLQAFLEQKGHECVNFGPKTLDMSDDYPDFIFPAALAVANGECELGIIWGGSGQGEAIVANRVKGVRCVVYYGPATAKRAINAEGDVAQDDLEILRLAREHNNSNMLSLGARFLDQSDVETAVSVWLSVPYTGADRHARRIQKIDGLS